MQQNCILYQKSKSGKIKQWAIAQQDNKLIISWGYLGSKKIQSTTDIIHGKNIGRSNETSPEEQAGLEFDRLIKPQKEAGYVENLEDLEKPFKLKFSEMPTGFSPAKPVTSIDRELVLKMAKTGTIRISRKVDGFRHYIVKDELGTIRIFSRTMKEMTANLPDLVKACREMPRETIIDCELFINDGEKDRFREIAEILRCKPEESIQRQKKLPISAFCFDLLYLSGQEIWKRPYNERFQTLTELINVCFAKSSGFLLPTNLLDQYPVDDLLDKKIPYSWEGLIVHDLTQSTSVTFDGKHDRKNFYKWRYVISEDCIAENPQHGNGKHKDRLGYLDLYQYHNGEKIYIGKVGSGFTDTQREELINAKYPMVVEVEFAERTKDLSLRFPVFARIREDKQPNEIDCVLQTMPRQE